MSLGAGATLTNPLPVDPAAYGASNATVARATIGINAAASVAAGAMGVTILVLAGNVNTVLGTAIASGESVTFSGYIDPVTKTLTRLPAIAYTTGATGSLRITTVI